MSVTIDGTNGITAPTLDLTSGQLSVADGGTGTATGENLWRNRIINGAMDVWQRATTYALTNAITYGSADRWNFWQGGASASGIANQVASGLTGFRYAVKLGRNSGSALTGTINALQALETVSSIPMQGQTITFSLYMKAGANFSSSSNLISIALYTGTGTDQSAASLGSWTGVASPINASQAITTSWVKYTYTATLSSSATQVGIILTYTPTGTAGADDNLYITGVQLEIGSTATSFEYRPYGTELALCQRYYEAISVANGGATNMSYGSASATIAGAARVTLIFKTTKRAAPTMTYSAANTFYLQGNSNNNAVPTAIADLNSTVYADYFSITATSTNGFAYVLIDAAGASSISASSEL